MSNAILDSHPSGTSNAILQSHNWASGGPFANHILSSNVTPGVFSITGASIVAGVVTVTGFGFGVKSPVAPVLFKSWIGTTAGYNWVEAGYTRRTNNVDFDNLDNIQASGGFNNEPAMHIAAALTADNSYGVFTHPQIDLPANSLEVFGNAWYKFSPDQITGLGGNNFQIKGPRAGIFGGGDASGNYSTNPHMSSSIFTNGIWDSVDTKTNQSLEAPISSTLVDNYTMWGRLGLPPPPGFGFNVHFNWETYYRFGDVGVANGINAQMINGRSTGTVTNANNRVSSGQYINYFSPHPGADGPQTQPRTWDIYISRPYVDITRARLFLGNASTIGACTGRFMLEPTVWSSGTSITANLATTGNSIPSGYSWVYVVIADGTISNGFPYTT